MTGGVAGYENTHGMAKEWRDETGTLSAEPYSEVTASVTICQVRNKDCKLNGLRVGVGANERERRWRADCPCHLPRHLVNDKADPDVRSTSGAPGPSPVRVNTETVYSGRREAGVVMTSVSGSRQSGVTAGKHLTPFEPPTTKCDIEL
jgi:hypothetical protein